MKTYILAHVTTDPDADLETNVSYDFDELVADAIHLFKIHFIDSEIYQLEPKVGSMILNAFSKVPIESYDIWESVCGIISSEIQNADDAKSFLRITDEFSFEHSRKQKKLTIDLQFDYPVHIFVQELD